jgi:hypothetical protein
MHLGLAMPEAAHAKTATQSTSRSTRARPQARSPEIAPTGAYGDIAHLQHTAGNSAVAGLLSSEAQPLDPSLRASMESRFRSDFSGVRVHTGKGAAAVARSREARAYTQGQNIVFAEGQFAPHEASGRRLLAHELAHVIQQASRGGPQPGPAHEREAESSASLAAASGDIPVALASAPGSIQCAPASEAEVRDDIEKERERFERTKKEHEKRLGDLGPRPVGDLPIEVLKKAGVTTTTTVGANTAGLIDSVLERSVVLRPYIKDKLSGKGKVQIPGKKFIHHDDDDEFDKAAKAAKVVQQGVAPIGSGPEKKNKAELRGIGGFYDRDNNAIHLRPKANVGDALHEAIHKFSSAAILKSVSQIGESLGKFVNEGVTQYFTNLVLQEQGLPLGKNQYDEQLRCAQELVGLLHEDVVAAAYFGGDRGAMGKVLAGLDDLRRRGLCKPPQP